MNNQDKYISEIDFGKEIKSYGNLPYGWDLGIAIAINEYIIKRALEISRVGKYYGYKIESSPLSSGGINLTFFKDDLFIDVNINPENTLDVTIEKGFGKPYQIVSKDKDVSMGFIERILIEKSQCDILLEPSRSENTSKVKEGFRMIKPFSEMKKEYQFSIWTVPSMPQKQYAYT